MTAPELKPCPFCGGEAVALTGPVKTLWGVTCLRCACWMDDRADTADEAVAAWNRRADLTAVQPQCCMCGKQGLSTSECDGGAECELHDGRWVCSRRCYDAACSMMVPAIEPHPDYTLAPRLQRIVEASKSAYKWDTVSDRMTAQPDPRDEVIARLVEALTKIAAYDDDLANRYLEKLGKYSNFDEPASVEISRAALAAAKAVQHG